MSKEDSIILDPDQVLDVLMMKLFSMFAKDVYSVVTKHIIDYNFDVNEFLSNQERFKK